MDLFNVIFSPKARGQLDDYIGYIQYVFLSEEAAKRVYDDAMETLEALSKVAASLQYCKNSELRAYGYRPILFRRHQYVKALCLSINFTDVTPHVTPPQ